VAKNWSYRAKNATLRAITNAGFNQDTFPLLNQYLFVNEPEAASIYTVRYLKQREAEKLKVCIEIMLTPLELTVISVENASFCVMPVVVRLCVALFSTPFFTILTTGKGCCGIQSEIVRANT
jgi:hypothetical protein